LEVHAVLETRSKMFCDCPVVDSTYDRPNSAVCPVCAGLPGVLPVVNQRAVEYALRVALALNCQIALTSIFARKSYFYPDLPKGYQITQYEQPLARHGRLTVETPEGEQVVRIRRVHLEEDTGKLTHVHGEEEAYTLVDLNRSGIPLLEIVTEPDMHSVEAVRAYGYALRHLLRYLKVNSGDMEKGLLRIEPNISMREVGSQGVGTRTEIKNLNSFRALERALDYEIKRQTVLLSEGKPVIQQTVGWDELHQATVPQRSKEEAEDYRYFPEPDLPPLVLDPVWVEEVRAALPELPHARHKRFQEQYGLNTYQAGLLVAEREVADFYEATVAAAPEVGPETVAHWLSGELFGLMKQADLEIDALPFSPADLGALLTILAEDQINAPTAKEVLAEMIAGGGSAAAIVAQRGLQQVSDAEQIAALVAQVLAEHPEQVQAYLDGNRPVAQWLFGQVMAAAGGRANPQVVLGELTRQLLEDDRR